MRGSAPSELEVSLAAYISETWGDAPHRLTQVRGDHTLVQVPVRALSRILQPRIRLVSSRQELRALS